MEPMHCKICGREYQKPYEIQEPGRALFYPVCSLLCAALFRRWKAGKRRKRAGCKRGRREV